MASTDASTAGSATADVVDRLAHPTGAEVAALDAWWRASNYLTVGQIYLMANPLLRYAVEHLEDMPEVRDRSLGDWAEQG